jgi:2-dehydro-3-deoxyphosphogluconate aldolase / (4S)-4-hydroxy-2-oxoglutarate aldolase
MNQEYLKILEQYRAIAVIRSPEVELGLKMAHAVAKGGIKLIEITWNSQEPAKVISQLRTELPDCWIGTGTILNQLELKEAIACGAQFAFSPHVNLDLIQTAIALNIPIIPGALTPTEIITAWQAGATAVKIFPIQAIGGANYIQGLQGPLGNIPLIPTGGVTLNNAKTFIQVGAIAVGLSGQLFPQPLVKNQQWAAITTLAHTLKQRLLD